MLLPQSSAFAALKNRLNSVSAIGYLHIAPRTYVSSTVSSLYSHHHVRQKSSETAPASSNQSTPGVSSFERPNRLKAREEGGIRWVELLEKFKSVQERARRAQRLPMAGATEEGGDEDGRVVGLDKERRRIGGAELQGRQQQPRPASAGSITRPPPTTTTVPAHVKAKSSLSNLGRFAGGVAARKTKK